MQEIKIDPRKKEYILKFVTELKKFIMRSNLENNHKAKKAEEIDTLFKGKKYLFGELFYLLYKKYSFDLNSICKSVFTASKAKLIASTTEPTNHLTLLLTPFLNSQKTFYTSADIEKTRFSRILKLKTFSDIYADEIYGIAVAIGVEPLTLFEYFFEKEKHSAYDLALKILELYIKKEKESPHKTNKEAETEAKKDLVKPLTHDSVNKLFKLICENPGQRNPFFQKELSVSQKTIQRWLKELQLKEKIEFRGAPKSGGYWEVKRKNNNY